MVPLPSYAALQYFSQSANKPPGFIALDPVKRGLYFKGTAELAEHVTQQVNALTAPACLTGAGGKATIINVAECPSCFSSCGEGEDATSFVQLECGHVYCRDCFDMWLGQGHFPLACFALDCTIPLSLRVLQSHTGESFLPLLNSALDTYVASNADLLKFCITPDCPQIYSTRGERVVCCSLCAVFTCTQCHVEEHHGMTCLAYKQSLGPVDKSRLYVIEEFLTLRYLTVSQL